MVTFTDLSSVSEEEHKKEYGANSSHQSSNKEKNFPVRLHYVLQELERDGLSHVISWMPHGRSFKVHNPQEFEVKCLPLWFRQTKFSSFQRQLNIYGFLRIGHGPDKGSYYNEAFLRGKRFLAERIRRVKIKGEMARSKAPRIDFYRLPRLPEVEKAQPKGGASPQTSISRSSLPRTSAGMTLGSSPQAFSTLVSQCLPQPQLRSDLIMPITLQANLLMNQLPPVQQHRAVNSLPASLTSAIEQSQRRIAQMRKQVFGGASQVSGIALG